jgi:hypothetical protein
MGCVEFTGKVADTTMEDLGWLYDEHSSGENSSVAPMAYYHE